MKTVAIIGPNGQLGTDLVKTFSKQNWNVIPLKHSDIEITDIVSVNNCLKSMTFDWVINTAAFHKVDECEKDTGKAWNINAFGQMNIASVANEVGAKSVYISSDYVFNGKKDIPYLSNDPLSPINAYGHSKAAGEITTLSINSSNVVMRISSVFGTAGSSGKGGNFIETIIGKAKAGEELKIVGDIKMSPTYTVHAAEKLEIALSQGFTGIFHGSNRGVASWYHFATYVLDSSKLKTSIMETESDLNDTLKRPKFSALSNEIDETIFGISNSWQSAVNDYLIEKGYRK